MPLHDSKRIEYTIDSGHITIVANNGAKVPAYWAHPRVGKHFSGICLLHDWWGSNTVTRLLANFFAQMGYYVIAPDMYLGASANLPTEAIKLYEKSATIRYGIVDSALTVLESHHMVNRSVAAIGLGMGGTLTLEAAIKRTDLEAAIACGGFPHAYFGQFAQSKTPILALYGSEEPYVKAPVIKKFQEELATTPLADKHQVFVLNGAGHDLFFSEPKPELQIISKLAMNHILGFLELYIEQSQVVKRAKY